MKQPVRRTTYLTQKSAAFWAAQINHNQHLRMALEEAQPYELIDKLYENLQLQLTQAITAVNKNDLAGKAKWLTLSLLTVNTLKVTLKFEWHPQLADNLTYVYEFIGRQLSYGLVEPFTAPVRAQLLQQLDLCEKMLDPLAEAWKELTQTAKEFREQQQDKD